MVGQKSVKVRPTVDTEGESENKGCTVALGLSQAQRERLDFTLMFKKCINMFEHNYIYIK